NNWNTIKSNYDEKFYRMWKYYLLSCAGSFRTRKNQLWQIVLSKKGIRGGYKSIR
ncbi:MAG: class I SAM-dependent methyltransferase, partial [Candidatus Zambryskibacteria bacterium]|nr:class I SAM-dependent methyltransferase [Candidatus Zambryskibacteria bacterium]